MGVKLSMNSDSFLSVIEVVDEARLIDLQSQTSYTSPSLGSSQQHNISSTLRRSPLFLSWSLIWFFSL
jgi:hypothetical protein